ncbi:disulfide bond formation protein DsbA [Micromonospora mangrovi]|uniref:Disulfide bond formation protein DsbA n=2 Tax=Micromonospora TaxID=1873 RepID=A0AAU7MGN9_9ACTN
MFVDPVCPWAWLASRWLLEAEQRRPLDVRFRIMSLSALNEGRQDVDKFYQRNIGPWRRPVRVLMAANQHHGQDAVRLLYTAMGTRRHVKGQLYGPGLYESALTECGLPTKLAAAADDSSLDDAVRKSHQEGMQPVGLDVGTPTIHVHIPGGETVALFGPVVTPAPTGEEAARLWDGFLLVAQTPGFYELKRSRTSGPATR